MKKKHGRSRRGFAGLGNMSGAGALGRDVLPGVLGIAVTIGGAIAIRSFVRPDPGAMAAVYRNAPLIGAGAGLVASGVVYAATRRRAGKGPAIGVATASVFAGALAIGMEKLNAARPGAMSAIADMPASLPVGADGTSGVVMEPAGMAALTAETRGPRRGGMRGDFGETVNAPIRGAVNAGAFGQRQSNMNG